MDCCFHLFTSLKLKLANGKSYQTSIKVLFRLPHRESRNGNNFLTYMQGENLFVLEYKPYKQK